MDWRPYYRTELEASDARERAESWLRLAFDADPVWSPEVGGVVSFPHTAFAYTGPLDARLVAALYSARVESVVALGVIHSVSLSPIRVALSSQPATAERDRAFDSAKGGFVLPQSAVDTAYGRLPLRSPDGLASGGLRMLPEEAAASEFSLDTFLAFLRLGADVLGKRPVTVLPVYVGMTRRPSDASFDEAVRLADILRDDVVNVRTAVVATGDLVHYGTAYGDAEPFIEDPSESFRGVLHETLSAALEREEFETAYGLCRDVLKSDQREILPVIANLLEGATSRIDHFALSDYTHILKAPPPCLVASVLATYHKEH